jgi:CheY-like chemotaxis protein
MDRQLRKILVVDDEADIRQVAKMALAAFGGVEVETASSAEEALAAAHAFRPDLILLDAMMPGVNGLDALKALRRLPPTESTPVVFMTAKVHPSEISAYVDAGALGVIPKPFDPMRLFPKARELWERR